MAALSLDGVVQHIEEIWGGLARLSLPISRLEPRPLATRLAPDRAEGRAPEASRLNGEVIVLLSLERQATRPG